MRKLHMKPPIAGEDIILIEDLIKGKSAAPASWPKYAFKFLDSARNYNSVYVYTYNTFEIIIY